MLYCIRWGLPGKFVRHTCFFVFKLLFIIILGGPVSVSSSLTWEVSEKLR